MSSLPYPPMDEDQQLRLEEAGWAPLLAALTRERGARLAKGQRPRAVTDAPG